MCGPEIPSAGRPSVPRSAARPRGPCAAGAGESPLRSSRRQGAGLPLPAERPDAVEALGRIDPQGTLDRGPRHVGQRGDVPVGLVVTLEPQDLHPLLDARVRVMVARVRSLRPRPRETNTWGASRHSRMRVSVTCRSSTTGRRSSRTTCVTPGKSENSGVNSERGVHRCPVPERHTRPSTSSRPSR
jgi:hypothetical protein